MTSGKSFAGFCRKDLQQSQRKRRVGQTEAVAVSPRISHGHALALPAADLTTLAIEIIADLQDAESLSHAPLVLRKGVPRFFAPEAVFARAVMCG